MDKQSPGCVPVPVGLLANPVVALALTQIEMEVVAVGCIRARTELRVEDRTGCLPDRLLKGRFGRTFRMAPNRQRRPLGDFKSHHIEAVAEGVLARLCSIALIAALIGGPDEKSRRSALELALGFGSDRFAHPARDALGHGTGRQRRRNDRDAVGKGGDENRILDPATVLLHGRTALEAQPELREALETGILGIATEIGLLLERGLVSRHLFRRPLWL